MIFSIKRLTKKEKAICEKTISSKAIYALVGDAIARRQSMSIVRMGDGERMLLDAKDDSIFAKLEGKHTGWNVRLGIEGMPLESIKKNILEAGDACTYFAPSISGISLPNYYLYEFFAPRRRYLDNFFVNDWTKEMIKRLLEASDGVCVLHSEYETVIQNFKKNYGTTIRWSGFKKGSWKDNDEAIKAAQAADAQLILFSAGPAGKIIGPKIASATNKIVIDVGNTLMPWSEKKD